jgi:hypothetical protein
MKRVLSVGLILILLGTVGCANMTPRQQRALSGGAMGAAGGAAVGAIVGGSPTHRFDLPRLELETLLIISSS